MNRLALALLGTVLPLAAFADHHEVGPSNPVETWSCVLKEGKTLDDVRQVAAMVKTVGEARQDPIAQWLFTPFTGDMSEGRFVLMTAWPSFASMGTSFQGFFGEGAGADVMVAWTAAADCETRDLYTAEALHNSMQ